VARLGFVYICVNVALASFACAQSRSPASSPRAVTLAVQSIAALTHGSAISDVKLTANITWMAGPEPELGTGVLLAKGTLESRIDLALSSGGKRTQIRNSINGPAGKWVNPDGKSGKYAFHNCWTDAVWFFPALSSLANVADSHFVFSYVGEETWNGLSAEHLRVYRVQDGFKQVQRLSTMDFYLDPASSLPLGVAFKTHPDDDMNAEISAEIRFADYQPVSGLEVPFHIQRAQNGAVFLDATVTGVSPNTGLSDEVFDNH
jgi:hypothetical protein